MTTKRLSKAERAREVGDRVVLALDLTFQSLSVLETAARLAARRKAELVVVFIEDVDLLNLAGLPFAIEVARASGEPRRMEHSQLLRAMRRRVEQARSAMLNASQTHALRASLRVRRGRYLHEALSSSVGRDVLMLARMAAAPEALRSALKTRLLDSFDARPEPNESFAQVWILHDTSEPAVRALNLARELAGESGKLVVVLDSSRSGSIDQLQEQVVEQLDTHSLDLQFVVTDYTDFENLMQTMTNEAATALVLPRNFERLADSDVRRWLESSSFPVVLVP